MWRELRALLHKELLLELRQRTTLGGILLYVLGMVFITALVLRGGISPKTWNVVFWLILSFSALGTLTRSFVAETQGQQLYLYQLASPAAILLAKVLYNTALMLLVGVPAAGVYLLLMGNPLENVLLFGAALLLGAISLASTLTLTSALVSRAGGQFTLMAVLSLPLLIPQLLVLIQITQGAILDANRSQVLLTSLGLSGVSIVLGLLLFPFLWRE